MYWVGGAGSEWGREKGENYSNPDFFFLDKASEFVLRIFFFGSAIVREIVRVCARSELGGGELGCM